MEDSEEISTVDKKMYEMVASDIQRVNTENDVEAFDNTDKLAQEPSGEGISKQTSRQMSRGISRTVTFGTRSRHEGTVLEWQGVTYSVPSPDKTGEVKTLLHPMSGAAYPGQLMGIMGTSGAGKSTLLDVLAGRLDSKDLKGTLLNIVGILLTKCRALTPPPPPGEPSKCSEAGS